MSRFECKVEQDPYAMRKDLMDIHRVTISHNGYQWNGFTVESREELVEVHDMISTYLYGGKLNKE